MDQKNIDHILSKNALRIIKFLVGNFIPQRYIVILVLITCFLRYKSKIGYSP